MMVFVNVGVDGRMMQQSSAPSQSKLMQLAVLKGDLAGETTKRACHEGQAAMSRSVEHVVEKNGQPTVPNCTHKTHVDSVDFSSKSLLPNLDRVRTQKRQRSCQNPEGAPAAENDG